MHRCRLEMLGRERLLTRLWSFLMLRFRANWLWLRMNRCLRLWHLLLRLRVKLRLRRRMKCRRELWRAKRRLLLLANDWLLRGTRHRLYRRARTAVVSAKTAPVGMEIRGKRD